jgi:hypothetical protein
MSASGVIFLGLGISAIFSLLLAWVQFASISPTFTSKQVVYTLIGLLSNSAVVIFPFVYVGWYPFSSGYLMVGLLAFSMLTIVVSFFGLKKVRLLLIIGAASVVAFLMMIPIGIL